MYPVIYWVHWVIQKKIKAHNILFILSTVYIIIHAWSQTVKSLNLYRLGQQYLGLRAIRLSITLLIALLLGLKGHGL